MQTLNRSLKRYDSSLYVQETKLGRYDIYRKSEFSCNPPNFLFALTDNWTAQGNPAQYGIEVILCRLKAHDMWRDDTFIEKWLAENEKVIEGKDRDRRNNTEAFLYDFRSQFQKATNDINTSGMKVPRRKEN